MIRHSTVSHDQYDVAPVPVISCPRRTDSTGIQVTLEQSKAPTAHRESPCDALLDDAGEGTDDADITDTGQPRRSRRLTALQYS